MSYNFNPYNYNGKNSGQEKQNKNDNSNQNNSNCQKNKNKDKKKDKNRECNCYKGSLRESLELLSSLPFSSYVDFSSFTLYGQSYHSAKCSTTLKSIASCNCDLLEYTDNTPFNTASLCDLVGYSFKLLNPSTNLELFSYALRDYLCNCKDQCPSCSCPQSCCECKCEGNCDSCCCNDGKAAKLNSLLGPVNLHVKGTLGPITNATLLAVDDDIVWLSAKTRCCEKSNFGVEAALTDTDEDKDKKSSTDEDKKPPHCPETIVIYAIPLYNIEFIG